MGFLHTRTMSALLASSFVGRVAAFKATKVQAKSVSTTVKADIYPEFGTYPGGGESPIIPFGDEKNAEREVIHGRWGMLGVTGAWTAESGTGIPWFTAGTLCTPDDCTAVADKFPGAVAPPAGRLWLPVLLERSHHRDRSRRRRRSVPYRRCRPGLRRTHRR